MPLTLATMQTELLARGFDYLSSTRTARFLNDANHRINDLEPWVYLQASTAGTSPIAISDLGRIESVVDVSNRRPLVYLDRRDLTDYFADLSTTSGLADFYYVTAGTTVNTFPVSPASITVRYTKVQTDMSSAGDVPLMPDRYRYAIVAYAAASAYRDVSNGEQAAMCEAEGDAIVRRMLEWNTLIHGSGGEQRITGTGGDW